MPILLVVAVDNWHPNISEQKWFK